MRSLVLILVAAAPVFSQVIPFSYTNVIRNFDQAGKLKSEARFLNATNRDGCRVAVDLDPAVGRTRQIIDVVNHRDVVVDPKTRRASIMARGYGTLPGVQPLSDRNTPVSCEDRFRGDKAAVVSVDSQLSNVAGVSVQRIVVEHPNASRLELLLAPSLGCEVLRSTWSMQGKPLSINTAENLQVGDPAPDLFEIPPGYQVTSVPGR